MKTVQEQIEKRLNQIPEFRRGAYRRAMTGKSRPSGVKAFCEMCMGWENVTEAVRGCTDPACPLFPYRPHRK